MFPCLTVGLLLRHIVFLCYHYRFRSCLCPPITVNSSQTGQRVDPAPGQRRGGLGAYWTAAMYRVPPQPGAGGTAHLAVSGPSPRTDIGPTSASRLQRRHKQCSTRVHSAARAEGDRKISALPATSASAVGLDITDCRSHGVFCRDRLVMSLVSGISIEKHNSNE